MNTTYSSASEMILEISTERRSGPGLFLSFTLKAIMLYLHCTMALAGFCMCRGWHSLGPYTAANTLFLPISTYAEPSAFFRTPASILMLRS